MTTDKLIVGLFNVKDNERFLFACLLSKERKKESYEAGQMGWEKLMYDKSLFSIMHIEIYFLTFYLYKFSCMFISI